MAAFFVALTGALVTGDVLALAVLCGACAAIMIAQGNAKALGRFLCYLWLPLAAGLILVWGIIVRSDPFQAAGSDAMSGFRYATLVSLRLASLAILFQATFLSLKGLPLAAHWWALGLSPNAVAGLVSVFQLWPDFKRRTDQIVAARCARGLMPDRRLATRVRQIPFAFRTLFLANLDSSFERADRWESEGLPNRLVAVALSRERRDTLAASTLWVSLAVAWSLFALRHTFTL